MKNIEILKNAHAKGHPVPKCRTEERTFNTVKSAEKSCHMFKVTGNDIMPKTATF